MVVCKTAIQTKLGICNLIILIAVILISFGSSGRSQVWKKYNQTKCYHFSTTLLLFTER